MVNDVATVTAADGGSVAVKLDAARGYALDAPVAEFEAIVRGPAEVEEAGGRAMFSQNFGTRGREEGGCAICTLPLKNANQPPTRHLQPFSDMDAYNQLVTKANTTYKPIFAA